MLMYKIAYEILPHKHINQRLPKSHHLIPDILIQHGGTRHVTHGHNEAMSLGQRQMRRQGQITGVSHGDHQVLLQIATVEAESTLVERLGHSVVFVDGFGSLLFQLL